jgi:hypothetical protein
MWKKIVDNIVFPLMVTAIIALFGLSYTVAALDYRQDTQDKTISDMKIEQDKTTIEIKSDLKVIRCLVGDKVSCKSLKN